MSLERATNYLLRSTRVLVVTGAGISAESGIPTFRGPGGFWEGYRAEELATPEAFAHDPDLVWRWYAMRHEKYAACQPHAGHHTLVKMEAHFDDFLLATQNVDGLHYAAGSRKSVELHGSIHRSRCTSCGAKTTFPTSIDPLPTCSLCGGLMRPDIVWFGEGYPPGVLEQAFTFAYSADVCLVVGTSAVVWPPAEIALIAQRHGAKLIEVNPNTTALSKEADVHLLGPAGDILPALWDGVLRQS